MTTEIYQLEILEREPLALRARISYHAAHPVFAGHFPGNPIVPGVCTLDMISDVLGEIVRANVMLRHAANVKFLQLIRPQDSPELQLRWTTSEEGFDVQASLHLENVVLMKLSGRYTTV